MGQLVSDVSDVLDYRTNKKSAESSKKEILSQMATNESEKKNLVKKVLASQRAKYGANGMSAYGQTQDNVLKRLQQETEEPYNTKKRNNIEKLKNATAKKKNMLTSILKHFDDLI